MKHSLNFLQEKARWVRRELLKMIARAKTGHTGGALSTVDILVALYYEVMDIGQPGSCQTGRDHFILSKGHSCEGLYCILADLGFFAQEELQTFCQFGTRLTGHPTRHIPGIEVNTGSLGHGLSIGVGMALAARMDRLSSRVYVLLGDGELAEGSVWEAAMAAANYGLDHLIAIVDRNGLQISGPTEEIMRLEPLVDKWRAFGWEVREVNGHDIGLLVENLAQAPWRKGAPNLLIAYTQKGRGVSFMEGSYRWHHRVPTDEELSRALAELGGGAK